MSGGPAMNTPRRTIGAILLEMGRITQQDVDRALAYQKENGGYFGDALVALGLVSAAEVEWGLADQYDLPFVQLRPENIDPAVAARVPAAWARDNLVLPVLSVGEVVTVILADPGRMERLEEVRRWTGAAEVQAAISTPETIRELIDAVHGERRQDRISLRELFAEALQARVPRVGVSVRGDHAAGWFGAHGENSRALLEGWAAELHEMVVPFLPLQADRPVRGWDAVVRTVEGEWRVTCHAVGGFHALEWVAEVGERLPTRLAGARLDGSLAAELRDEAQAGGALVTVTAGDALPEETLEVETALLPSLVLGRPARSAHLTDRPGSVPAGVLGLPARPPLAELCAQLESFGLEAVTVDLAGLTAADLEAARMTAPLIVVRARDGGPAAAGRHLLLASHGGETVWTLAED